MIVKVAAGRRDGESSFDDLADYITEGIEQSGEAPTKTSWEALTQYITAESVLDALGEDVEKTIGVEIGNLESLKTAPHEMRAVASRNGRQKNPVYHYILSWPEAERPAPDEIFAAARHTLKGLGMLDHQYIVAIHANTDNIHAHVEVNRVHPRTFKAARLAWAHATLHQAAREAELMFGWQHDKGIYEVVETNGQKHVVRSTEYIDPDLVPARGAANRFETWSGEQSLETWCKGAPATELKAVLAQPSASSWQDVHRVLARHGLDLRDSGGGGMKIFDVSEGAPGKDGKPLVVSASKAFRFLKRAELESRFGPFTPKAPDLSVEEPRRTYKRDPQKRLDRRLARKDLREALHARFKEEMKELRARREIASRELSATFGGEDQKRLSALDQQYRQQRQAIQRNGALSPVQKQQAYMLAKITAEKARAQLKGTIATERAARRSLLPPVPTWREWVEQQAQLGDEAAISALRGLIYQEKRDGKIASAAQAEDENAILPAAPRDTDPYVRALQNVVWKVARNGRVTYSFKSGDAGFTDEGEKLTFGRREVSDEALMVTLRYAADKWGGDLRLAGGDAAFKARVVRMAVELGLDLKNRELQDLQRQIRGELAHVRQVRPPAVPAASAGHAEKSIESVLRTRDSKAQIESAITQTHRYSGRIVAEDSRYIAQRTDKNTYVLHEKSAFKDSPPAVGKTLTVRYQSGGATVQSRPSRGRGGK